MTRKSCLFFARYTGCRKGLVCKQPCPSYSMRKGRRYSKPRQVLTENHKRRLTNCVHKEIEVVEGKIIRYCRIGLKCSRWCKDKI